MVVGTRVLHIMVGIERDAISIFDTRCCISKRLFLTSIKSGVPRDGGGDASHTI